MFSGLAKKLTKSFIGMRNVSTKGRGTDSIDPFDPTATPELFQAWISRCSKDEFCQVVFHRPARRTYFMVVGEENGATY
jgi:hypothetical protein